jgi:hypothetical protein
MGGQTDSEKFDLSPGIGWFGLADVAIPSTVVKEAPGWWRSLVPPRRLSMEDFRNAGRITMQTGYDWVSRYSGHF